MTAPVHIVNSHLNKPPFNGYNHVFESFCLET